MADEPELSGDSIQPEKIVPPPAGDELLAEGADADIDLDIDGDTAESGGEETDTPARPSIYDQLEDNAWQRSLWRPFLITILAGCLVVAFMAFARRIVPSLPAGYTQVILFIGLITAAIGCVSTTWLAQPSQRGRRNGGYRAAELAFIIVFTRIAVWAALGDWPGFDLLLRPIDSLLDTYFIVGLLAVLLAWIMATAMTDDMIAMGLRPDDIYMSRSFTDKWQDTARPVYTDRPAILRRFTGRWVVGGVLLVVMAAGSRFAAPQRGFFLPIIGQNIDRAVIIAAIVYFLVGLALISQGQLALLRARWTLQKTPSAPGILNNWPVYALILILVAAFIAALMPLGGTFHLALILTSIIEFAYWLIVQIFGTIVGLFLLLASLFRGEEAPPAPEPTPAPLPPITPPPPAEPSVAFPPWTGGAIFWIIAALLLGYAAYIYFGGRGVTFAWLRQLWDMLRNRWNQMLVSYRDWQTTHIRADKDEDDSPAGQRRRRLLGWLGYRGLDPDAQVRYYYLAMLEQAEQVGHPRRASETPLDYAPRLADNLARGAPSADVPVDDTDTEADSVEAASEQDVPEGAMIDDVNSGEPIRELTDAFVRVRYAAAHFAAQDASRLRERWNQIKRQLRP